MSPTATTAQRKEAAVKWRSVAAGMRIYAISDWPIVVGMNNFSEITFIWPNNHDKQVNHCVHWWNSNQSKLVSTTYEVSLNHNHPDFLDLPLNF